MRLSPAQEVEVFESYQAIGQRATARKFGIRDQLVHDIAERKPSRLSLLPATQPTDGTWTHRWFLRRVLPQYHGSLCRIKGRGDWAGLFLVEFPDGKTVSTTTMAIRRIRGASGDRP